MHAGEVVPERGDVLAPPAQGRDLEDQDGQAVEEVVPEGALAGGGHQVAVGGADQAEVRLHGGGGAHGIHLTGLEGAQELGLQGQRQLAHLVEEEGAAGGGAQAAGVVAVGAGEGAADVAEELGFGQLAADGAAVDRHERALPARAGQVDQAGDELLAGAALAGDQHGRLAVGGAPGLLDQVLHGLRAVHQAVLGAAAAEQVAQALVVAAQGPVGQGAVDGDEQLGALEGLEQVGGRAQLHGLHGLRHRAVSGEHDHRRARRLHRAQDVHAVAAGHLHVGEHQVGAVAGEPGQARVGVGGGVHLVAGLGEHEADHLAQVAVVVDEQYPRHHDPSRGGRGNVTTTRAPSV